MYKVIIPYKMFNHMDEMPDESIPEGLTLNQLPRSRIYAEKV